MENQRFYDLLNKINIRTNSQMELDEFYTLLQADPELKRLYQILSDRPLRQKVSNENEAKEAYLVHYAKMQLLGHFNLPTKNKRRAYFKMGKSHTLVSMRRLSIVSLVLVLIIFSTVLTIAFRNTPKDQVLFTKKGQRRTIILSDGTKVWMNVDSKLNFPSRFSGSSREVSLTGEAYFEVAPDKKHPFVITTKDIKVNVLGTSFNLKAYPRDEASETTLIHGAIEIDMKDQSLGKINLKPGDKLKVYKHKSISGEQKAVNESTIVLSKMNIDENNNRVNENLWIENKLIFDGESFSSIALKLERWYNIRISIEGKELRETRLTGYFESQTIEQILKAFQYATKFTYKIEDKNIEIRQK